MNLFWLDIETTGLDPRSHIVLEVAFGVADFKRPYELIDTYQGVVTFNGTDLDPFILDMHTRNGLLEECRNSPNAVGYADIEHEINRRIPTGLARDEMPILAGSSIHFDRSFLQMIMPDVMKRFSHRHYDVSSIKLFCESMGMPKLPRAQAHRAMADVLESIEHAKQCAEWVSAQ